MLTISQLAAHAGVTVRAVRHYHATGLLPEPERDRSGYRRYPTSAVVELIRIRTLAEAGVPLSRVRELLSAGPAEFAAAVDAVDRRLRAEIRERQEHRRRIARLRAGDSLALPDEALAYFARIRELGLSERFTAIERDSWIVIAAQIPAQVAELMAHKIRQVEDETVVRLYRDLDEASGYDADDPRLATIADRLAVMLERDAAQAEAAGTEGDHFDPRLVALLDETFLASFPAASRLLELLEERGWTGWTMIERSEKRLPRPAGTAGG